MEQHLQVGAGHILEQLDDRRPWLERRIVDEEPAEVVRRIFNEYIDGNGDRAIANMLNRESIPCPSALQPAQNRHRLADGWQESTVRAILDNPRYTGNAVFGRWTRHEMLLDPDDVAAGNVTRFRRASPDRIRSAALADHPITVTSARM